MADMFCYQCEQAAEGIGCTKVGVCGKKPDVAALQDLIVWALRGIAFWGHLARIKGAADRDLDVFMIDAMFSTVTNVDFDPLSLARISRQCAEMRDKAQALYENATGGSYEGDVPPEALNWKAPTSVEELVAEGRKHPVKEKEIAPDVQSAIHTLIYGVKGMCAYADHVHTLGKDDDEVYAFIHKALAATIDRSLKLMDFVNLCMECGRVNLKCQENLYTAHAQRFEPPKPTPVEIGSRSGKCILVSGHDLPMLEELLKQTEGKGINVYTHVEMLPAHGYPKLKKYSHLAGNYGGGWQDQYKELQDFPGAIIFNTNCIQRPAGTYKDRLFTWGRVQWPEVKHIDGWDFTPVIDKALASKPWEDNPQKEILTGCGQHAVLGLAEEVIQAVKDGDIRHFFVIGGCDGAKPGRNYYTNFVEQLPQDTVVMTLACGKFRFNKLDLGNIGNIPRLLDVGQCNDTYQAVQVAVALADAFDCGVNDLPLSIILSWYEQKAVVCLLSLLSLGIQNIRLGPSLPAFVTPNVLNFLVEEFNLAPIGTPEEDMRAILG